MLRIGKEDNRQIFAGDHERDVLSTIHRMLKTIVYADYYISSWETTLPVRLF